MSHYDDFEPQWRDSLGGDPAEKQKAPNARNPKNINDNYNLQENLETITTTYKLKETESKPNQETVEIPSEMFEFIQVLYNAANSGKYSSNNWLQPNGITSDSRSMHASMFRHLAESTAGNRKDKDSGLDPLLHLACRALMYYTRIKRGLNND